MCENRFIKLSHYSGNYNKFLVAMAEDGLIKLIKQTIFYRNQYFLTINIWAAASNVCIAELSIVTLNFLDQIIKKDEWETILKPLMKSINK